MHSIEVLLRINLGEKLFDLFGEDVKTTGTKPKELLAETTDIFSLIVN